MLHAGDHFISQRVRREAQEREEEEQIYIYLFIKVLHTKVEKIYFCVSRK